MCQAIRGYKAQAESKRVATKRVKMEEKVVTPLTPLNQTLGDMSPWIGGWAPFITHTRAKWLLPIMKLSGGT